VPGRNFLSVEGRRELAEVARDLRRQADGREVNADLRQELSDIGAARARAVRASIRAIPSKGQSARRGRRSLRSEMAAATESKVRTTRRPGVIVRVNPGRMPPGKKNLPAYMEGDRPFHRWRKPVFQRPGRDVPWVTQRAHPYFARAVAGVDGDAERAGLAAIKRAADRFERG
jgi:hypothetical protein